jgi:hypothetical protein
LADAAGGGGSTVQAVEHGAVVYDDTAQLIGVPYSCLAAAAERSGLSVGV